MGLRSLALCSVISFVLLSSPAVFAGVTIAPYASISSNKAIKPNQGANTETSTTTQKTTYGISATLGMFSLLKAQASIGQSQVETSQKTDALTDEFGEIDFQKDANLSTNGGDVKKTEIDRNARVGLALDPSFSIFLLRAKVGVQATQRLIKLEQTGQPAQSITTPITYKPYAGAGAGVKLSPRVYWMIEYGFFFYKFPKTEPFEREVSVSFGVSL